MKLLLGKNGATDVHFDAQDLVTGRACVIAQSGGGKSYLIAVMCEKLLAAGVGFCLVDPEGEYASLKEKFDLLLIGPGSSADENIHEIDFPSLSERLIAGNIPAILDVSEPPPTPGLRRVGCRGDEKGNP
jgi:DNA helicase HerA-like ATPase